MPESVAGRIFSTGRNPWSALPHSRDELYQGAAIHGPRRAPRQAKAPPRPPKSKDVMKYIGLAAITIAVILGFMQSKSARCINGPHGWFCAYHDAGWGCEGNASSHGNGLREENHACDDCTTESADGCRATCGSDESCANDLVAPGEQCDGGAIAGEKGEIPRLRLPPR